MPPLYPSTAEFLKALQVVRQSVEHERDPSDLGRGLIAPWTLVAATQVFPERMSAWDDLCTKPSGSHIHSYFQLDGQGVDWKDEKFECFPWDEFLCTKRAFEGVSRPIEAYSLNKVEDLASLSLSPGQLAPLEKRLKLVKSQWQAEQLEQNLDLLHNTAGRTGGRL